MFSCPGELWAAIPAGVRGIAALASSPVTGNATGHRLSGPNAACPSEGTSVRDGPLRGRRGRGAPGCCRRDPQRRRTAHDQRWRGGDLVADGEWRVGAAHRRRSKSPCPADSSSQTRRTVSITWIGKQHAPLTWSVSDQPGSPAISVTSPGSSAVEAATRRGAGWCRRGRRRSSGWAAGTAGPA